MYNPVKILDDAFRKGSLKEKYKKSRPHPVLASYEMAAFLSFVPGLFIFLGARTLIFALILSAASVMACFEIEKGRYLTGASLLGLFNLLPATLAAFYLVFEIPDIRAVSATVLYGLLGAWGCFALYRQRLQSLKDV